MKEPLIDRIKRGWNAFNGKYSIYQAQLPYGYGSRPDKKNFSLGTKKKIVSSIYNQIAVDCAQIKICHSIVDKNGNFVDTVDDDLNNLLTLEANEDQTGRAFIQDVIMSMLDEGVVAIVPIIANSNPYTTDGFADIKSWRTGKIVEWYPKSIKVDVYNEFTGRNQEIICPKKSVGIIENPFYSIMNEPNSILQRLINKLNLLDKLDGDTVDGKLDIIMQLPYSVKTPTKELEAQKRVESLRNQLTNGKINVGYVDATEKITQLNRPIENKLLEQIDKLQEQLYAQLGLNSTVFNGTADEQTMLNYYNRTIEPILSAVTDELKRKFLSKTARSLGHSFSFFRDPFRLTPAEKIADIADKLTRNAILSSNEFRGIIGYEPSDDPMANQLSNKNMPMSDQQLQMMGGQEDYGEYEDEEYEDPENYEQ